METKEYTLKVSGKMSIEKGLGLGDDVVLTLHGSIVKVETFDNQDGTRSVCYIFKAMTVDVKEDSN